MCVVDCLNHMSNVNKNIKNTFNKVQKKIKKYTNFDKKNRYLAGKTVCLCGIADKML